MNNEYPCLIIRWYHKQKPDEYCDLYRAAPILSRSMRSIYECLEAYGGKWYTTAFEVTVEDESSRIRRSANKAK